VETSAARAANRSAVLARILGATADAGGVTRAWLAEATGLSPATVSRVTDGLIAEGLITEGPSVTSGRRGRNAVSLQLGEQTGVVCGIDLGGANCRFVLSDLRGQQVGRGQSATPTGLGAAELADWLAGRVRDLASAAHVPEDRLRAVSVGLPGMVTEDGSSVGGAPNVPQIEGTVFARRLAKAIPVPVGLHNDADLALLGELRFGAGRGLSAVVMFTIGAGFGAGVALGGRLLRGRHGLIGEFGYLPAGPSGELAEELLSGTGLLRRARSMGARVTAVADIFAADAPALLGPLREQFDRALLLTLTAASTAYEPEAVILGGGLSPVIGPRLDASARRLHELLPAAPALLSAELGDLSGALGAVAAACQGAYRLLDISESDTTILPTAQEVPHVRRSAHH
jgi:predicted NBD/HSP70 family sugar kinase